MSATLTRRFATMGGSASVHLASATADARRLDALADAVQRLFDDVEEALSPFRADSELSALNRDGRRAVPASALLAGLARAARRAASQTRGLVDPTVPLQARPRDAHPPPLDVALAAAPPRRAAAARPGWAERRPTVDRDGRVCRPPGVTLDPGGLAKGMAADLAGALMPPDVDHAIACGGDLAVGGRPWEIAVLGAWTGEEVRRLAVAPGGVATSGIHARLWRRPDGTFAHHLLDPSTGRPAWTGLVAVTAVAGSALDAEILAKRALLCGPLVARRLLRVRGGVLQHDDGRVEQVAGLAPARLEAVAA
jgi:FAD:protein FMN transferase